ncbi:YdhK family protein [Metabacillus sediminilitoris]|uniref:DUF1541 domain-containing protein n=1 Tax=Metabacillus sediminilitoris TaxID=2567941 RepID=A0A4S4BZP6_9BACI|nr:YdhK family protein [Metabacillus sediminilitoris]QGQ44467.1 DUF1541 domain-containing protein [Metabacillus sediminilitoris]THF80090.1 DUF1541 domain-containing protein [Metabacillus sediminilitoris]
MSKKIGMGIVSLILAFTLSACASNDEETKSDKNTNTETNSSTEESTEMDHSEMNHSGSGEVPEGLKEAENPTYKVGSQANLETDHMEGMKGAEATIVGAYETTAYVVSYTPTTGGEKVENHKWVIHEEIENAGDEKFEPGTEVVLNADHMEGMKGATAEIDSAEETTVYMVDYTPTNGGEKVKNHKWVTESELSSK